MYKKFRDKEDGVIKVVLRPGGVPAKKLSRPPRARYELEVRNLLG
jgi:hypothetical protein